MTQGVYVHSNIDISMQIYNENKLVPLKNHSHHWTPTISFILLKEQQSKDIFIGKLHTWKYLTTWFKKKRDFSVSATIFHSSVVQWACVCAHSVCLRLWVLVKLNRRMVQKLCNPTDNNMRWILYWTHFVHYQCYSFVHYQC